MEESTTTRIRHIIWDWNGTLLDDKWLCIESINFLLQQRGLNPISEKRYSEIFGFPVRDYYQRAGFNFNEEPFEIPALQFIGLYNERRYECKLQPGAREVLQRVSSLGISQSLLSASETRTLEEMTGYHGIQSHFGQLKGLDNHYAHGKLDLGNELVKSIPLEAGSVLMVGDTCHDSEVAAALGVECVLFSGGHFPEYRLVNCGRILIDRLTGLIPVLSCL